MVSKSRVVVFLGNCQLGALSRLYQTVIGDAIADQVLWLPSYQDADPMQRQAVAEADILVRQVQDFVPKTGDLGCRGAEFLFPHVAGSFLWPNAGQPHPRNAPAPFLDDSGPYPAEIGDSFLDRMIAKGVEESDAVKRYLDTDVAATRRVDRLMELVLDRQRKRDIACGYDFADKILAGFQTRRLFRTQNHPEEELTLDMASALFSRMGVPVELIDQLRHAPPDAMFPLTEAPLHPSIIAHFRLTWADPDDRYRYFQEGRFTFAEFAARYLRYEWNPLLAQAFHFFWRGERRQALDLFARALPASPRSAVGRAVYADLLTEHGELAAAELAALEAVVIEPHNADYRSRLNHIMALRRAQAE